MESVCVADRITVRTLRQQHPDWRLSDVAEAVNRSLGWVKQWLTRFATASPTDLDIVRSRSCARHRPPARVAEVVVARILDIRDHPPAQLGWVPGPKAMLYYLHQDAACAPQAPARPAPSGASCVLMTAFPPHAPARAAPAQRWHP